MMADQYDSSWQSDQEQMKENLLRMGVKKHAVDQQLDFLHKEGHAKLIWLLSEKCAPSIWNNDGIYATIETHSALDMLALQNGRLVAYELNKMKKIHMDGTDYKMPYLADVGKLYMMERNIIEIEADTTVLKKCIGHYGGQDLELKLENGKLEIPLNKLNYQRYVDFFLFHIGVMPLTLVTADHGQEEKRQDCFFIFTF